MGWLAAKFPPESASVFQKAAKDRKWISHNETKFGEKNQFFRAAGFIKYQRYYLLHFQNFVLSDLPGYVKNSFFDKQGSGFIIFHLLRNGSLQEQ